MHSQFGDDLIVVMGSYQSGQMGLTVTQLSFDFGGSNPSLPTNESSNFRISGIFVVNESLTEILQNLEKKIAEVAQLIEH